MSKKKRVVITGLGIASCFGTDVDLFYDSLLQGKSGVTPIDKFPCEEFPTRFAASVQNFDTEGYIEKKQARRVDPFIAYSIVASKKALQYAGLSIEAAELTASGINTERCGIIIGSGMGGMGLFTENVKALVEKGPQRVSPFFIPYIITNMASGLLAIDLGFNGPNYSVSTACASSNHSIYLAANHIQRGDVDLMICGGAEAGVTPIGLAGFSVMKALSRNNENPQAASRPWDKGRDGFVVGEGAGILVLESLEHAEKRGAKILAEYLGGAVTCDAYHITEPRSDGFGVSSCLKNAIENAEVDVSRINFVNAHATSTMAGDIVEINALKKILKNPSSVALNATKSMIGHALGAAAGLEAVAIVKAIQGGVIHPTINLDDPEEGLEFFIPSKAHKMNIDVALSNSFGFGGHNSALLFAPYQG